MPIPSRISQHAAFNSFSALRQLLVSIPNDFRAQQGPVLDRLQTTLDLLEERFNDTAAEAVSDGALNNAQSWLQVMLQELQNAINANSAASVANGTNFYNHMEALSQNLGQFPTSQPTEKLTAATEEAQRRLAAMQQIQMAQEAAWRAAKDQQQRLIAEAQDAKDAGLKRLEEQEVAAGRLLAALGAQGTSTGYAGTASAEKKQADFWRKAAVVGGVITAILAVVLFWRIGEVNLGSITSRIGVLLPAVLLTVYAGQQSAGHRAQEREAKRLELAFGSVDAYLADLDSERRAELKRQLSASLFNSGNSITGTRPDDYPTSTDLVALLSEAIRRIPR